MAEETECKKCEAGMPGWVMTFADLMSLLMCFFVLLLSFSEMDVQFYKQVAGSMRDAFGVQREVNSKESPRGVSIIAREFSPGRPDPTPLRVVRQHTTTQMKSYLDLDRGKSSQNQKSMIRAVAASKAKSSTQQQQRKSGKSAGRKESVADKLRKALQQQVNDGAVDIKAESDRIIIRITERASFKPGSAFLTKEAIPVLAKIGKILRETTGQIVVSGHTDNVPVESTLYRSNWELSSSRAATVVGELNWTSKIVPERLLIEGHGDNRPLVPNVDAESRRKNRRVEIVLLQNPEDTDVDQEDRISDEGLSAVAEGDTDLVGDASRGNRVEQKESVVEQAKPRSRSDSKAQAERAASTEAAKATARELASEAATIAPRQIPVIPGRAPAATSAPAPAVVTPPATQSVEGSSGPAAGGAEPGGIIDEGFIQLPSFGFEPVPIQQPQE